MDGEKPSLNGNLDHDEMIRELRSNIEEKEGASPTVERDLWAPKEISTRRSARIVRGLTILMTLVFFSEIWFLVQQRPQQPTFQGFEGGPPVEVVAAPMVQAPQPAPPIEDEELYTEPAEEEYPIPPTPTAPPVPDEIKDIEMPPPDA